MLCSDGACASYGFTHTSAKQVDIFRGGMESVFSVGGPNNSKIVGIG